MYKKVLYGIIAIVGMFFIGGFIANNSFAQSTTGSDNTGNCSNTPCPTPTKFADIKCKANLSDEGSDGPCSVPQYTAPVYLSWSSSALGCVLNSPTGPLNTDYQMPYVSAGWLDKSFTFNIKCYILSDHSDVPVEDSVVVNVIPTQPSVTPSPSPSLSPSPTPPASDSYPVSSPTAGQSYNLGSTVTIKWNPQSTVQNLSGSKVFINLIKACPTVTNNPCIDDLSAPKYIISNSVDNSGEYMWKIPLDFPTNFSGDVKLLIGDVNTDQIGKSGIFTITRDKVPTTSLDIVSPLADSIWSAGNVYPIKWVGVPNGNPVTLTLDVNSITDGPMPVTVIIAEDLLSQGSYNWKIPSNLDRKFYTNDVQISLVSGSTTIKSKLFKLSSVDVIDNSGQHKNGDLVIGLFNSPFLVSFIENGVARPFTSFDVFLSNGFRTENIAKAFKGDDTLQIGKNMELAVGSLVHGIDNPRTYYVIYANGIIRGFTTYDTFLKMGYRLDTAYSADLRNFTEGDPISTVIAHAPGTDILDNGTVYWIRNDGTAIIRSPYPSVQVYNSWHSLDNDFSRVVKANDFDKQIKEGGIIEIR